MSKLFSAKEFDSDRTRTSIIYNFINIGLDEILEKIKKSLFSMLDDKLNRWPTNQEKIRLLNIFEVFGYLLQNLLIIFKTSGYFCKKLSDIIGEMVEKVDLIVRNHISTSKLIEFSYIVKNLTCIRVSFIF